MKYYHIIDIGNTNIKIAKFNHYGKLISKEVVQNYNDSLAILEKENVEALGICNVNKDFDYSSFNPTFVEDVRDLAQFKTKFSKTLGSDRFALCYYLQKNYPSCVVLNSGTFTTLDFLKNETHLGGFIFPGIKLLTDTYSQGARLNAPDFEALKLAEDKIPTSTEAAISQAVNHLNDAILDKALEFKTPLIITGGGLQYFRLRAEKKAFKEIIADENLLLVSLFNLFMDSIWD